MHKKLTIEEALQFAPDRESKRAARRLISIKNWRNLGHFENGIWGECQGSGKIPYKVKIDLTEPTLACNCPSRKYPCKHSLALLTVWAANSNRFTENEAPSWMSRWLRDREKRKKRLSQPPKAVDRAAQAKRHAQRLAKIQQGMAELSLWLEDLTRNGLGSAQAATYGYWDDAAARMVDAQAPGAARMLREMGGLPASGGAWGKRMLGEISKLYLLAQGMKQFDQLDAGIQADLRSAVGWNFKENELLDAPKIHDRWHILGQIEINENRLKIQRNWLRGGESGKVALILYFAHQSGQLNRSLIPGTIFEGDVVYYPGKTPLRGFVRERLFLPQRISQMPGGVSIETGLKRYRAKVAGNPWLTQYPLIVRDALPVNQAGNWFVQDAKYRLPLAKRFAEEWALAAISGGHPVTLFGEWDGDYLLPLSVSADGQYHDLTTLRGGR